MNEAGTLSARYIRTGVFRASPGDAATLRRPPGGPARAAGRSCRLPSVGRRARRCAPSGRERASAGLRTEARARSRARGDPRVEAALRRDAGLLEQGTGTARPALPDGPAARTEKDQLAWLRRPPEEMFVNGVGRHELPDPRRRRRL